MSIHILLRRSLSDEQYLAEWREQQAAGLEGEYVEYLGLALGMDPAEDAARVARLRFAGLLP